MDGSRSSGCLPAPATTPRPPANGATATAGASKFLHHLSRDGDPQLHVHVAIWNRTQRADGADGKYRTLFGRPLFNGKIGLAPVPDRFVEARMRELGFVMETREDGNGCEVAGVPKVMQMFSSRGVAIGPELAKLAAEYERVHGKPPSKRTLWLLHQQAGQRTRRSKAEARRTVNGTVHDDELSDAERLAAWEMATTAAEMAALSRGVRGSRAGCTGACTGPGRCTADRTGGAPPAVHRCRRYRAGC